ncbi:MAG: hypothetical protein NAOJABEB_03280 [Steroidobacteraceae bacterium]|nr:hypothetical protein [Steroidobacteraceae bacterium]
MSDDREDWGPFVWGNATAATAQAMRNPAQADQSHNHVRAILYLRGRGRLPQDDRPHSLRVRHNDWCALRGDTRLA